MRRSTPPHIAVSALLTCLVVGTGVALAAPTPAGTTATAGTVAGTDGSEGPIAGGSIGQDIREAMPAPVGWQPPTVGVIVSADFGLGEPRPARARTYDSPAVGSDLRVAGGYLAHGRAQGAGAISFLETRLPRDLREIGARIRFAPVSSGESGSVSLVGWRSSFVAATERGAPTPETGLRLVVTRGAWELSVVPDDVRTVATGTFAPDDEVMIRVVRDGATLFVVAPDGRVTRVAHPAVERLAGRWASWGLTETGPDQNPAAIGALWAG